MVESIKKHKAEVLVVCVLAVQIAALVYYNLTKLRYQADFDSSTGMLQLAEIWRQKTFLLRDWKYQTVVGWDLPLPFAVPFFALTKNVFFSVGMANNLFVLGYMYVVYDILKKSGVRVRYIITVLILLFTPYTLGQLGYYPMLFIGTAPYSMKTLITFLLLDIIVRLENRMGIKKNIVHIVLFVAFSLTSGMSSGIYMLICGIVPVMFYLIMKVLIFNDVKQVVSKPGLVTAAGAVAFVIGGVLAKGMGLSSNSSSMQLLTAAKFPQNALSCFTGIWELFGALHDTDAPQVLSKAGIICLLSAFLTAFLIFLIVYYAVRLLRGREKRAVVAMILCVEFVNMSVLLLTDTTYASDTFEYRYHIVAVVPALLLFGFFFQDMSKKLNDMSRTAMLIVVVLAALAVSTVNFRMMYADARTGRIDQLSKITDAAKEQGIDLIYVASINGASTGDGRLLRLCDLDIGVVTLSQIYNFGAGWGDTSRYYENGRHPGKIMTIADSDNLKELPDFLKNRMKKIGKIAGYHVFVSEENIFDCSAGMPEETGEQTVDFPYSPGYMTTGTINEEGELVVPEEGTLVIYGVNVRPSDGVFDICLNYRVDSQTDKQPGEVLGKFTASSDDGKKSETIDIIAGEDCVIKGMEIREDMEVFHYSVETVNGSGMSIKSITTTKIQ